MDPDLDEVVSEVDEIVDKMETDVSGPSNIIWFEFLLNPSLLEDHLINENSDPSATDLITQFLANSTLSGQDRDQTQIPSVGSIVNEKPENDNEIKEMKLNEKKKDAALKLLALKVAAHIKWDLGIIQSKLSMTMQNSLLSYLLYVCLTKEFIGRFHPKIHLECLEGDLDSIKDEVYFSIVLFHRWCARTLLADSVIVKPVKQPPVPFIGMQDSCIVSPAIVENILRTINEWIQDSQLILEKCLLRRKDVIIPSYHTFDTLSEDKNIVNCMWEEGTKIDSAEIVCQIAYDLGCLYFYQRKYGKAGELLFKSYEMFDKMVNPKYCSIDYDTLKGYCTALGGILKKPVVSSMPSLTERLQACVNNSYENVIPILLEDNVVCEISLAYREQIATDLSTQNHYKSNLELQFQVRTLNVIRWIMAGRAIAYNYIPFLIFAGEAGAHFLLKAVDNVLSYLNVEQKRNLTNFIKYVCTATSSVNPIIGKILKFPSDGVNVSQSNVVFPKRDFFGHPSLQLGELEINLHLSYDVLEIWNLIPHLHSQNLRKPAWLITNRWELPNPLHSLIIELPQGYSQEATYVLMAKVRELINLNCYGEARRILEAVEGEIGSLSFKLLRLALWEILLLDLRRVRETSKPLNSDIWSQELFKQTKSCLSVALEDRMDFLPRSEVVEECALFLINIQQWDYLSNLNVERGNCLEFPILLSKVCNDMKPNKNNVRELWDIIIPIFASKNGKNKRGAADRLVIVSRDIQQLAMPRTVFHRFISKMKNLIALTVLVSYLVRIHNILKDDDNNSIPLETLNSLLPSVISNSNAYSIRLVQESLVFTLDHALKLYPMSISFLKSLGSLHYAMGYHADALKHYLQASMLSSDYFSSSIPNFVFDDTTLRRMIRCCTQLQCHTQASILCQFLDVVDYNTAFKCLQEKLGMDGIDCYYNCIWDMSILEFLVYIHNKRGEVTKKELALQLIGQLELNSNNNEEIQREAANLRKSRFLRAMVRQYL
ncbi:Integrator complex subunit 8 [Chamberlinius hualienensis]